MAPIIVHTNTGKKIPIELDSKDTVGDLKQKICDIEGIPPASQRLGFDRIELRDDDGLVVDQVNEIIRKNEGEPIEGDSCISLWLILRLKGGANIIYHKPIQQQSSSSSDSDSDDTELIPRNRQNVAFLKPDKIECNPSSDSHVLLPNGSPESAVSNGADANGPEHNTSEARVKGLPDSLKPSQENGIHEDSDATNIFPEKGHSVWMFASDAGISVNVGLLMIAAAVFLVPKAMREIPQISRMLQSKVGKHDGIERILKRVSDAIVEHGRSFALSATLLVVAAALLFLAIRCCRRSPTLQSLKQVKQNLYLEVLRDGERVKVSVSNIIVGDIVLSEPKGKL